MPIPVQCPSCEKKLTVPDTAAGKRAKCPACGAIVAIPGDPHSAAEPAGQAPSPAAGEPAPAGGQERRPCPTCGEMIVATAAKCRFCGAIFDERLEHDARLTGSGNQDLKKIAIYQKAVLVCILVNIISYVAMLAVPLNLRPLVSLPLLIGSIAAVVFVVLLAINVYSVGAGIVFGILALIPCVGLIALLVVNQKATKLLTEKGFKVGLLGASLSQF